MGSAALDGTAVPGAAVGETAILMYMDLTHMPRRTTAVGGVQDDWGQSGFAHGDPHKPTQHADSTTAENRITTGIGGPSQTRFT